MRAEPSQSQWAEGGLTDFLEVLFSLMTRNGGVWPDREEQEISTDGGSTSGTLSLLSGEISVTEPHISQAVELGTTHTGFAQTCPCM